MKRFLYLLGFLVGIALIFCSYFFEKGFLIYGSALIAAVFIVMYIDIGYYESLKSITRHDGVFKYHVLQRGPKIAVIGGGSGLSTLLRGLKEYTSNIVAIVTVADDGGGSGMIREEMGLLPPGDIRNCILALANTEPEMDKLLNYRFKDGSLKGQSFGNLFLAAMSDITGSFEKGIEKMSEVLSIAGKVLPVTLEDVRLVAELSNGAVVEGESRIPVVAHNLRAAIKNIYLKPQNPHAYERAIDAVREADVIVIGPGSLYTSLLPNFCVSGMNKAVNESNAVKIYIANIMTQPGETEGYDLFDHYDAIRRLGGVEKIDYIIANTGTIPEDIEMKYNEDGAELVKEIKKIHSGPKIIYEDLIKLKKDYVRHDEKKLAYIIMELILNNMLKNDRTRILEYYYTKSILMRKKA
ncbi:MAG: YvcK family protein [Thermoanaerobacteraceae bacterium]|nr:YvcK family protein [Thermoanaerobacteraceae bacterium]